MFGFFTIKKPKTIKQKTRAKKVYTLDGFSYTIRSYAKSKSLRVSVGHSGRVTITKPRWVTISAAQHFVANHTDWIKSRIEQTVSRPTKLLSHGSDAERVHYRAVALELINERIAHFNQHYHFRVGNISIRNQTTRWGSCSSRGNLNFNYNIVHLPADLADYLIVHELCHLEQMNHSDKFWSLVEQTIPDYRERKKRLQTY